MLVFLSTVSFPLYAHGEVRRSWPTMGTLAEVIVKSDSTERAQQAIERVRDVFDRVNRTMSVYRRHSDVTRVNRWAGFRSIGVDPWVADVIKKGKHASYSTDGAFSIDVLAEGIRRGLKPELVNVTGPGGQDRLIQVRHHPARVFLRRSGMGVDLGGIAKGYAIDRARDVLRENGVRRYFINLGRNLSAGKAPLDKPGWPVGIGGNNQVRFIEDLTVSVSQQGLQSDTAHIIRPGESDGIPLSTERTIVAAKRGWVADMASTALLVEAELAEQLKRTYPSIQWIQVTSN